MLLIHQLMRPQIFTAILNLIRTRDNCIYSQLGLFQLQIQEFVNIIDYGKK